MKSASSISIKLVTPLWFLAHETYVATEVEFILKNQAELFLTLRLLVKNTQQLFTGIGKQLLFRNGQTNKGEKIFNDDYKADNLTKNFIYYLQTLSLTGG